MAGTQVTLVDTFGNPVTPTTASGVLAVVPSDGTNLASVFPAGFLRTTDEPRQVFYDPHDSTLDTTNRWNAPVSSGGGVGAAVTAGVLSLATGTTGSGYSYLTSQPTFTPTIPGWLGNSWAIALPDLAAPTANTYRFWGIGTVPATPTTAAPVTDGYGFELATNGVMYAVTYAAGVRTVIQDLSAATGNAKQPTTSGYHRYGVFYRTDRPIWFIDSIANTVAAPSFPVGPTVQTLPLTLVAVAASSAPGSSGVLQSTGEAVWDTAKNNTTLSDGKYGWRKATVKPANSAALSTDTALAVTQCTAGVATQTAVAVGTSSTTLLAANPARISAVFWNNSATAIFLKYGATATTSSFTTVVGTSAVYKLDRFEYSGIVTACTSVGTATSIFCTELTLS